MCGEIESIKNICIARALYAIVPDGDPDAPVPGEFSLTLTGIPSVVNEVVVKSITWNGKPTDTFLYLLWSNINNGIIGSFSGACITTQTPGTRIKIHNPLPNVLTFRLMHPRKTDNVPPTFDDEVMGDIAICLDLITYKQ